MCVKCSRIYDLSGRIINDNYIETTHVLGILFPGYIYRRFIACMQSLAGYGNIHVIEHAVVFSIAIAIVAVSNILRDNGFAIYHADKAVVFVL